MTTFNDLPGELKEKIFSYAHRKNMKMVLVDIVHKVHFNRWLRDRILWERLVIGDADWNEDYSGPSDAAKEKQVDLMMIAYGHPTFPYTEGKTNHFFWDWFESKAADFWIEENLPWEMGRGWPRGPMQM